MEFLVDEELEKEQLPDARELETIWGLKQFPQLLDLF